MKSKIYAPLLAILFILSTGILNFNQASAANQPRMRNAIRRLRRARSSGRRIRKARFLRLARRSLSRAAKNKGGHRVKAIRLVNRAIRATTRGNRAMANRIISRAIRQVRLGINYANRKRRNRYRRRSDNRRRRYRRRRYRRTPQPEPENNRPGLSGQ